MAHILPVLFRGLPKDSVLYRRPVRQISRRSFTKWQKIKLEYVCSTLECQRREMGDRGHPYILESSCRPVDIKNVTLTEFLWEKIDRYPDYTAIECGITGHKYTFSQIKKLSQRFAVSLLKSGIQQGQTVAIISPNCPEYPIVVLGCIEAGLVATLVNYVYTADELCHQLNDSEAVCVVAASNALQTAVAAITKVKESTKSNKQIKLIALDSPQSDVPTGVGRFTELIADYVNATELPSLSNRNINASEIAILPYSSGTTGLSKGVELSHKNLVSNILQMSVETDVIETSNDHQDIFPGILPFYHIYGFTAVMAKSIFFGSKVVTFPKFEPKTFLEILKNHKCSIMYIVPPLVLFLGSSNVVTKEHFSQLRSIVSGAAPIGEGDVQKCLNKVPRENNVIFRQAYGLTESSPLISISSDFSNFSTIGSPVSNTIMKIVNIDNGDSLGPNQTGEICAKGPQIMVGYHKNPKATAATIDSEGWLHTGDVGYYDDNGLIYIVDRIKELIKVKGFQVPPAELEELLRGMPGVIDAGVVGVPDKRAGEVPIAFVVPDSSNSASVSDIKAFISNKVAPYKQLSDVVLVGVIPKSASGKILRREIKEAYIKSRNQT